MRHRLAAVAKRIEHLESTVLTARRHRCPKCRGVRERVWFVFEGDELDEEALSSDECSVCQRPLTACIVKFVVV